MILATRGLIQLRTQNQDDETLEVLERGFQLSINQKKKTRKLDYLGIESLRIFLMQYVAL